jgi:hypothetical protein
MDQVLYVQAMNMKFNKIVDLREWLSKVKSLDNKKHFECFEAIKAFKQGAAASHTISCANTTSQPQNNVLTGPSCKANSGSTTPATADSTVKPDYHPKLMDEEKALLLKYDSCLKCRKPFVYHKSSNKAPGCAFPVHTGYRPVTFVTIMAAMPANYKTKVASVVPSAENTSSSKHPVTAVFSGIETQLITSPRTSPVSCLVEVILIVL